MDANDVILRTPSSSPDDNKLAKPSTCDEKKNTLCLATLLGVHATDSRKGSQAQIKRVTHQANLHSDKKRVAKQLCYLRDDLLARSVDITMPPSWVLHSLVQAAEQYKNQRGDRDRALQLRGTLLILRSLLTDEPLTDFNPPVFARLFTTRNDFTKRDSLRFVKAALSHLATPADL